MMTELFEKVGIALLVAVPTALLTVWLSLRRFYREKWWEAKMRAYAEVIQSLHDMKRDLDVSIRAELKGRNTNTRFFKELDRKHRAAWDEIHKNINIGAFLYSPRSIAVLEELRDRSRSDPKETYLQHSQKVQKVVDKCLPDKIKAARADLGLPPI